MIDTSLDEVRRLVAAANAARRRGGAPEGAQPASDSDAERQLELRFRTSRTLAVYGSLAPGRSNHHVVAPLGGEWTEGVVEGELLAVGWGASQGYSALVPRDGGPAVAAHVLTAPGLAAAWPELDRFEGAEYRRVLVPVFTPGPPEGRRLHTVANLYAAAAAP